MQAQSKLGPQRPRTAWRFNTDPSTVIGISVLPGRKNAALYQIDGSVLTPLAYFRDDDSAAIAVKLLNRLAISQEV